MSFPACDPADAAGQQLAVKLILGSTRPNAIGCTSKVGGHVAPKLDD